MITVLVLGFTVGVILALTGAGGGILAVPFLVFGVGLSMAEAGPIGLLAVGLAATLGAVMGLRNGIVRYKAALVTASAGVICSPLGLWLAQRTPNRPLTILFALLLMYVAFRALQKSLPSHVRAKASETRKPPPCVLDENRGKLNWTGPLRVGAHGFGHGRWGAFRTARRGRWFRHGSGAPAVHQFDHAVGARHVADRHRFGFHVRGAGEFGDGPPAMAHSATLFHGGHRRHARRAPGRREVAGTLSAKRLCPGVDAGSGRPAGKGPGLKPDGISTMCSGER